MKRYYKKLILIIMLIGIFLLSGCSKIKFDTYNASKEDDETNVTLSEENNQEDSEIIREITNNDDPDGNTVDTSSTSADITKDTTSPTPAPIEPSANIELSIYTVNSSGDIEPITALVSEDTEITPQIIVDKVLESLADQSILIGVNSVTTESTNVIVNFDPDKTPDKNLGSGYEAAILDAIAQSLIDNVNDYSGVIYRIDEEPYVSGVFELGIDEIYLGDN